MKKKIVSKVFAILLAACTVLSACGNESGNQSVGQTDKSETNDTVQEGEEPYTIVYAFDVWVQQADWDLVEENLSNIVYDKIGAKVKLLPMTGANYQQEVNLMITSGEKLDLVNASARTTFSSDVTSNKLLGLDEETVRKYAPDAMEVIGDYMEATTVDGKIYGFPHTLLVIFCIKEILHGQIALSPIHQDSHGITQPIICFKKAFQKFFVFI